ncbi:MAG: hypothetical protein WCJ71_11325, partial [Candidatus Omnitrophota bacterium]
ELLDTAISQERKQDIKGAQFFYDKAIKTYPQSWKAHKMYGKFCAQRLNKKAEAISLYRKASLYAPSEGKERSQLFREWGVLLQDSGDPHATTQAMEKFEEALVEAPNDFQIILLLVQMFLKQGMYLKVIEKAGYLENHKSKSIRTEILPILLNCYEKTHNILKKAEIIQKIENLKKES